MRLSRLTRLSSSSSQIGFFPDASKFSIDAMKRAMKRYVGLLGGRIQDAPPKISHPFPKLRQHLLTRFYQEQPNFPKIINQPKRIQQGMLLDSNSIFPPGLRLKICNSKYIMVCCFFVPLLHESAEGRASTSLISVTSELRELYGSDFEMVLVAKMRQGWLKHKPSFDHFFSGFPDFCRVIPFSDSKTRHHMCNLLWGSCFSDPRFVLLERCSPQSTGNCYSVLKYDACSFFTFSGAEDFPFTQGAKTNQLAHFPSQLDGILGRKSSDLQVSRFGGDSAISLSELRGKVVGLYLCYNGSLMVKLDQVTRDCRESELDFEVVLIYMPFYFICNAKILMETVNHELYKLCNTQSWWIMPYIDSISRRLRRMSPTCSYISSHDDKLIIVGPNGKYVDPYAGEFLRTYGVDVYPFTCDRLIEWKLEKVRSVTLESLLVHGNRDFLLGRDSNNGGLLRVPVKQLYGKVVLVCFDYDWSDLDGPIGVNGLLDDYYDEIKSEYPNFEAVFVSLDTSANDDNLNNVDASELPPWLVCPPQPDHSKYVYDTLRIGLPSIVAFGEDGRVCSFRADDSLMKLGVDAFPFKSGDLRQEVIRALAYDNDTWTVPQLGQIYV